MNVMFIVQQAIGEHSDFAGRAFFLFLGIFIGYVSGCVRKTMKYARIVKHEVHQIHQEVQRVEGKIDKYHPEEGDDSG
jgi:hypothetical protein